MKTIVINDETHHKLTLLKLKYGVRKYDDVINMLFKHSELPLTK